MARPLFDTVADFTGGPPNTPGVNSVSLNSVAGTRTQAWATQAGRQYELGNAEAGTMSMEVFDAAESLNPVSTTSPWNTGANSLLPYRCIQRAGWWNAATLSTAGNLVNATNTPPASTVAYDPSFESGTGSWGVFGTAATIAQSATHAFDGSKSLSVTLTVSGDRAGAIVWTVPGQTYTFSVYVWVPATYTVTLVCGQYPALTTYGTATSSTTGAWQRLSVTAVATNAVSYFRMRSTTAPSFPFTFWVDAVQVELASSATTFTTVGPTRSPRFTGYIERYPLTWLDAGFRGDRPLECVDALSVLSRTVINQSYAATALADNPNVFMPLNEPGFPQVIQLPRGGLPFQAYTQLGSQSGAVNFGGDTFLDGSPAVTVVQQNTNPVTFFDNTMVTYLGTKNGAIPVSPVAATYEFWLKFTSGVIYCGASPMSLGESTVGEVTGTLYGLHGYTGSGSFGGKYDDPNGGHSPFPFWPLPNTSPMYIGQPDGLWHHFAVVLSAGNNLQLYADGAITATSAFGFTPSAQIAINNLNFAATTYFGDPVSQLSAANVAVYPVALTLTQLQKHYQRGAGYINEVSGARVARLLAQYWSATGYTAAAGYAQMAPDFSYNSRSILDVVQEITFTENGFLYASRAGAVVWEDRTTRAVKTTSSATLAMTAGQVHYSDLEYDYDPTYVYSQVNLTRPANNAFAPQVNATSQTAYGQRILSATLQVNTDFDLNQAAIFLLHRYAYPGGAPGTGSGPRVRKIVINPAADPSLWGFVMGLELSQRITIAFTTSTGLAMNYDYYVEMISESGNPEEASYTVELQVSPVFVPVPWILGDATFGVLGTTTVPVY